MKICSKHEKSKGVDLTHSVGFTLISPTPGTPDEIVQEHLIRLLEELLKESLGKLVKESLKKLLMEPDFC